MTPSCVEYCPLLFLLETTSFWSQTREGRLELTNSAFQGPSTSPCALFPDLHRFKDTVKCAALGT